MAALLSTRFPLKAPELFAYLAAVVRDERNYESGRWVAYASRSLDWSVPDPRLYSEAWQGPSLAVLSVSWTTTSPRTALRTRTVRGGDGLLAGRLGRGRLRAQSRLGSATPAGPSRYAGVTMRVDVGCRHAVISIPARNAGETTLPSSAAGSASGTGPHLTRPPPRCRETQYGHAANATNIVPIYYYI